MLYIHVCIYIYIYIFIQKRKFTMMFLFQVVLVSYVQYIQLPAIELMGPMARSFTASAGGLQRGGMAEKSLLDRICPSDSPSEVWFDAKNCMANECRNS